ncbi:hypothetical protein XENOCAPTIV_030595, partial [Xenoophorus captivus]
EGIEVPLPLCGGQGQVMRTRENDGLPGMACAVLFVLYEKPLLSVCLFVGPPLSSPPAAC